jgi:hypothetical protein
MKVKAIRPLRSTKAGERGTVVYDGIKGKVVSRLRLFHAGSATYAVFDFNDDTEL